MPLGHPNWRWGKGERKPGPGRVAGGGSVAQVWGTQTAGAWKA